MHAIGQRLAGAFGRGEILGAVRALLEADQRLRLKRRIMA